jgi:hypothetical protein
MKRAGEVLAALFDEETLKNVRNYSALFSSWAAITEEAEIPAAAAHSRVVDLKRCVLLVETDHPGWIQLLRTKQRQLLDALRRRFSDLTIRGISFRLSRDPQALSPGLPGKDREQDRRREKPGPEAEADSCGGSAGVYEKITDEGFKETLKRLEQSIASKNKPPKA